MADRMAWSRWEWLTVMGLVSCVMLNHKSVQLFDTDADLLHYYSRQGGLVKVGLVDCHKSVTSLCDAYAELFYCD